MSDQRLEQLKAKYQSVLNLINQLGVQLQNLHVQDNKLFLKGHAKTKADSNKVWDQIKLVDSNYQQDLHGTGWGYPFQDRQGTLRRSEPVQQNLRGKPRQTDRPEQDPSRPGSD